MLCPAVPNFPWPGPAPSSSEAWELSAGYREDAKTPAPDRKGRNFPLSHLGHGEGPCLPGHRGKDSSIRLEVPKGTDCVPGQAGSSQQAEVLSTPSDWFPKHKAMSALSREVPQVGLSLDSLPGESFPGAGVIAPLSD